MQPGYHITPNNVATNKILICDSLRTSVALVGRTPQIPSPPSVGSNGSSSGSGSGSAPRAGTREVHNKLEKNRRAHLKECFELLKRQLPATPDDKKTSNLSILASAIRYIQVSTRYTRLFVKSQSPRN